jgi:hypothetical protein
MKEKSQSNKAETVFGSKKERKSTKNHERTGKLKSKAKQKCAIVN